MVVGLIKVKPIFTSFATVIRAGMVNVNRTDSDNLIYCHSLLK